MHLIYPDRSRSVFDAGFGGGRRWGGCAFCIDTHWPTPSVCACVWCAWRDLFKMYEGYISNGRVDTMLQTSRRMHYIHTQRTREFDLYVRFKSITCRFMRDDMSDGALPRWEYRKFYSQNKLAIEKKGLCCGRGCSIISWCYFIYLHGFMYVHMCVRWRGWGLTLICGHQFACYLSCWLFWTRRIPSGNFAVVLSFFTESLNCDWESTLQAVTGKLRSGHNRWRFYWWWDLLEVAQYIAGTESRWRQARLQTIMEYFFRKLWNE